MLYCHRAPESLYAHLCWFHARKGETHATGPANSLAALSHSHTCYRSYCSDTKSHVFGRPRRGFETFLTHGVTVLTLRLQTKTKSVALSSNATRAYETRHTIRRGFISRCASIASSSCFARSGGGDSFGVLWPPKMRYRNGDCGYSSHPLLKTRTNFHPTSTPFVKSVLSTALLSVLRSMYISIYLKTKSLAPAKITGARRHRVLFGLSLLLGQTPR